MICNPCKQAVDSGQEKHYCVSPPSCPCKHGGNKPWQVISPDQSMSDILQQAYEDDVAHRTVANEHTAGGTA